MIRSSTHMSKRYFLVPSEVAPSALPEVLLPCSTLSFQALVTLPKNKVEKFPELYPWLSFKMRKYFCHCLKIRLKKIPGIASLALIQNARHLSIHFPLPSFVTYRLTLLSPMYFGSPRPKGRGGGGGGGHIMPPRQFPHFLVK